MSDLAPDEFLKQLDDFDADKIGTPMINGIVRLLVTEVRRLRDGPKPLWSGPPGKEIPPEIIDAARTLQRWGRRTT